MIEENILTVWVGAVEKEIRNVKKKTTAGGKKEYLVHFRINLLWSAWSRRGHESLRRYTIM